MNNKVENITRISDDAYNENRFVYLDFIRIFAAFFVIMQHVSSLGWHSIPINTFSFNILLIYNLATRFDVQIFVLISGALFLDASYEISLKKLYTKKIFRLFIVYVVWSLFYAIFSCIITDMDVDFKHKLIYIIKNTVKGHYHMWFLLMLIGVYMFIPILKPAMAQKNAKELSTYFLVVFFILGIMKPSVFSFDFPYKKQLYDAANLIGQAAMSGWLGYFVLGFYLKNYDIKKQFRYLIYFLSISFYILTVVLSMLKTLANGQATAFFASWFSLSSFFSTVAWFLIFKYGTAKIKFNDFTIKRVRKIANKMLGVYIIHPFVIEMITFLGFKIDLFNVVFSIPIVSIFVFLISYGLISLMSKIKFIDKYLI